MKMSAKAVPGLALWLFAATSAQAQLWLEAGDMALRHDLQVLKDAGRLHAPITTWPVYAPDLAQALNGTGTDTEGAAVQQAYRRLRAKLRTALNSGPSGPSYRFRGATEARLLRDFEDTPRRHGEAQLQGGWVADKITVNLRVSAGTDPQADGEHRRISDGSYATVSITNWLLTYGTQDRWWGPGWDGSLILSSNARPVRGVSVNRKLSQAPQSPWLSWIGPWTLNLFAGRLEDERAVPEPYLMGLRAAAAPAKGLEIGLSRTAIWGGTGQPEQLGSLTNLITLQDDEPGRIRQQLGGIDARWSSPIGNLPYAVYAQAIANTLEDDWPLHSLTLWGIEFWGNAPLGAGAFRLYMESASTLPHVNGEAAYDTAYSHQRYATGYRRFERSIGHVIDNDSRMLSLRLQIFSERGNTWGLWAKDATINDNDAGQNAVSERRSELLSLGMTASRKMGTRRIRGEIFADRDDTAGQSQEWTGGVRAEFSQRW